MSEHNAENILKQLSVNVSNDTTPEAKQEVPVGIVVDKPTTMNPIKATMPEVTKTSEPVAVSVDESLLVTPVVSNLGTMCAAISDTKKIEPIGEESAARFQHLIANVPEESKAESLLVIQKEYEAIIKELMINEGFTKDQAATAAFNRINREHKMTEEENLKKNPEIGVITIDKTSNVNDLGMTEEEHSKLERVKKIKLIVVENADLEHIEIERPDEEFKANYVRSFDGALSKYSVPTPMYGDFISFKGAQIMQMINCIEHEDTKIEESINTKASLIYDKIISGTVLQKTDEAGKMLMSYEQFINKFPYQDIDMAMYGIVCASSMEETATSLTCDSCKTTWEQKYNVKKLLKLDHIDQHFKERVDTIVKNSANPDILSGLIDSMRLAKRYKSPTSNNIYDLSYPTIARALNILRRIGENDNVMAYVSAIALYLSRILIYNPAKGSYVEIMSHETDLLMDTVKELSNEDMNLLAAQIRADLFYEARFEMDTLCPSCGLKSNLPLSIKNLIFLKAQDSMVEIDT